MRYIRAAFGAMAIIFMNNLGIVLLTNYTGIIKIMGIINFFISAFMLYFVVLIYMESDFFKSLGKENKNES